MRMRDIRDIKDIRDLRDLLERGRVEVRRAVGGPEPGTVALVLVAGIALGALVGAVVAALMTPMPGREARQRLAKQAEHVRERMPEMRVGSNGRHTYPATELSEPPMPSGTARPMA